jgi:L-alanine-DL-glutamate epimerase-like enolase superfamily enzyme
MCTEIEAGVEVPVATARAATPAAAAAMDMALHDLRARSLGVPVYTMLGGRRDALPTSITIGINDLEETRALGRRHASAGFRALKVKGGRDAALDAERMLALRADLGDDIELRFDANEGYCPVDAQTFLGASHHAAIAVFEQPTKRDDPAALAAVRKALDALPAPRPALLADEDAIGLQDVESLAVAGQNDGVVVKLMKCGGIAAAMEIDAIAAGAGMRNMVSCMDESALAIAAGLHYALAARSCSWIDLDGHLDLLDDPTSAAIRLQKGCLEPAAGTGFGVELRP